MTENNSDDVHATPAEPADGHAQDLRDDSLVGGLVVGVAGGFCEVQTDAGRLRCQLRGKLRKQLLYSISQSQPRRVQQVRGLRAIGPVSVGDRVRVRRLDRDSGVVEEVLPREQALTRRAVGFKPLAQTVLAGVDQVVVVFAVRDPAPHLRMFDRFLVVAESAEVPAIICLNKVDLGGLEDLAREVATYRRIGYPVIPTSAATGEGLAELRSALAGKTSAVVGPSGVGKSSLLNALRAGLGLEVGDVNRVTGKGRHTTTGVTLLPLGGPGDGYVADTPGLRLLDFWELEPSALDECFREMRPYLGRCRFAGCTHVHEPGCAVREAVQRGEIDPDRYESYVRLR